MLRIYLLLTLLLAANPLQAMTVSFTASASGNICKIFDTNAANGLNDCNEIDQQNGNPMGMFSLSLAGLPKPAFGPANFSVTSADADVFGPTGGNSSGEFFDFSLNSLYLGRLFDDTTNDEAAGPARGLAGSVQSNIAVSGFAPHALDLNFSLAYADFAPLMVNGKLTAYFDFGMDRNVNRFVDPSITVRYRTSDLASVPLPTSAALMLLGLVLLAQMKRNLSPVRCVPVLE